jgi:hypothetical protein
MSNSTDRLVESFVSKLNASGLAIQTENNTSRLSELEARLPKRLPQSFTSLLSLYSFSSFDVCGISLFAWDKASNGYLDATKGPLAEMLLPAGFVQIGRPDTGDFDAVCFDLNTPKQNREYQIVRIYHEEILCNSRVKIRGKLWPSFRKLIERVLSGS